MGCVTKAHTRAEQKVNFKKLKLVDILKHKTTIKYG